MPPLAQSTEKQNNSKRLVIMNVANEVFYSPGMLLVTAAKETVNAAGLSPMTNMATTLFLSKELHMTS